MLVALVLCYVIGVGSAFASSTALLTEFIPLSQGTVVDVSPFSTDGALVVANACEEDRQRVYRQADDLRRSSRAGRPGARLGSASTHRH